jgi:hypothetical protein
MSGEVDADVSDGEHVARNLIEPIVNNILGQLSIPDKIDEWSFISIILSEKFTSGFPEIAKKSKNKKNLEFRLNIPHDEFKGGDGKGKISLIFDAMFRSVDLMSDLGVSEETQEILRSVLEKSRSILLSK